MAHQQTIRREVACAGIGLHTGKKVSLRFMPAPADTGVVFRRVDAGGHVQAKRANLSTINYATSLSREGISVATIEHLQQGKVLPTCLDVETSQDSFREAVEIADVLIPGRDNVVLNPLRKMMM